MPRSVAARPWSGGTLLHHSMADETADLHCTRLRHGDGLIEDG